MFGGLTECQEKELKRIADKKICKERAGDVASLIGWMCIQRHGSMALKQLTSTFRSLDTTGDGLLDKKEFHRALQKLGLDINKEKSDKLFTKFDEDFSGSLSSAEFINQTLDGVINKSRRTLVSKLFDKLDWDKSGYIEVSDIEAGRTLDTSQHPAVKKGEMTRQEAICDFLAAFEDPSAGGDGKISREEFLCHYAGLSGTIEDDAAFSLALQTTWTGLSSKSERNRSWPEQQDGLTLEKSNHTSVPPHGRRNFCRMSSDLQTFREKTKTSRESMERPKSAGNLKFIGSGVYPTVVVGNRRSLYRSVAPSYFDNSLFGESRSQRLMESDWPVFEAPWSKQKEGHPLSARKSTPLKWAPSSDNLVASLGLTLHEPPKVGLCESMSETSNRRLSGAKIKRIERDGPLLNLSKINLTL